MYIHHKPLRACTHAFHSLPAVFPVFYLSHSLSLPSLPPPLPRPHPGPLWLSTGAEPTQQPHPALRLPPPPPPITMSAIGSPFRRHQHHQGGSPAAASPASAAASSRSIPVTIRCLDGCVAEFAVDVRREIAGRAVWHAKTTSLCRSSRSSSGFFYPFHSIQHQSLLTHIRLPLVHSPPYWPDNNTPPP